MDALTMDAWRVVGTGAPTHPETLRIYHQGYHQCAEGQGEPPWSWRLSDGCHVISVDKIVHLSTPMGTHVQAPLGRRTFRDVGWELRTQALLIEAIEPSSQAEEVQC